MKKESVKKELNVEEEDEVSKMIEEAIAQDPEFVQENMVLMEGLASSDKPAPKLSAEKPVSSVPGKSRSGFKPVQYKPRQPAMAKIVVEEVDDGVRPVIENVDALVRDVSARVRFARGIKEVDALRSVRVKREADRTQEVYEILEEFFISVERLVQDLTKNEPSLDVNRVTRDIFARVVRDISRMKVGGKAVLPSNLKPRVYGKIPVLKELIKDCLIRYETGQGMTRTDVLAKIGRDHSMYRKVADSVFLQLVEDGFVVKRLWHYYLKKK